MTANTEKTATELQAEADQLKAKLAEVEANKHKLEREARLKQEEADRIASITKQGEALLQKLTTRGPKLKALAEALNGPKVAFTAAAPLESYLSDNLEKHAPALLAKIWEAERTTGALSYTAKVGNHTLTLNDSPVVNRAGRNSWHTRYESAGEVELVILRDYRTVGTGRYKSYSDATTAKMQKRLAVITNTVLATEQRAAERLTAKDQLTRAAQAIYGPKATLQEQYRQHANGHRSVATGYYDIEIDYSTVARNVYLKDGKLYGSVTKTVDLAAEHAAKQSK